MKKNSANIKGFAMTELLAVSIVILLIFTVLVSNYLPILAEYENRTSFTNVTADYAAFYVRKLYKSVLENATNYNNLQTGLETSGYRQIYKDGTGLSNTLLSDTDNARLSQIIKTYEIEEIVITSYKLTKAKTDYKKSSGVLYDYIKYLPNYTRAIYGSQSQVRDPFRIILKTKNYGFATTQIMPDPPTSYKCFTYNWDATNKNLVITKYTPQAAAECEENKENVVIDGSTVTVPTANAGTKVGQVGAIGDNAFKNIPGNIKLKSIDLEKNVTQIGKNAFEGNEISVLHVANQMPGVVNIGDNAFRNNQLAQIMIPDRSGTNKDITFGKGVFSNNYTLQAIKFDFSDYEKSLVIASSMFALDDDSTSDNPKINKRKSISIVIPETVKTIQDNAFKNLKIESLSFEGLIQEDIIDETHSVVTNSGELSKLDSIGKFAFGTDDNLLQNDGKYIELTIPKNVTLVGENAFRNVKISELNFEDRHDLGLDSKLGTISAGAFSLKTIASPDYSPITKVIDQVCEDYKDNEDFKEVYYDESNNCIYKDIRGVKFPTSLKTIADHAFQNQLYTYVSFDDINEETGAVERVSQVNRIDTLAFAGNDISAFEMPYHMASVDSTEGEGRGIFGNIGTRPHTNSGLGDTAGSLLIKNESLFDNTELWCKAIFGVTEDCTVEYESGRETVTEEDKEEALADCTTTWEDQEYESEQQCREEVSNWKVVEEPNIIYTCKKGSTTKYITKTK